MSSSIEQALVLDIGSFTIKMGTTTTTSDETRRENPIVVRNTIRKPTIGSTICIPGIKAISHMNVVRSHEMPTGLCSMTFPVQRGKIVDSDGLGRLLDRAYEEDLGITEKDRPNGALLSTPVEGSINDRRWLLKYHFETLSFDAVALMDRGTMVMYSIGATAGCSLNVGHGLTQILPMYHGTPIAEGIRSIQRAGQDMESFLLRLLKKEGQHLSARGDASVVRRVKESATAVALNFEEEFQKSIESPTTHRLPDGSTIELSASRVMAPEMLFRPEIAGHEVHGPGVHDAFLSACRSCPVDVRSHLLKQVVLTGGTTKLSGFIERFEKEIKRLLNDRSEVSIVRDGGSVYRGGQIAASSILSNRWCSKSAYEEEGADRYIKRITSNTTV